MELMWSLWVIWCTGHVCTVYSKRLFVQHLFHLYLQLMNTLLVRTWKGHISHMYDLYTIGFMCFVQWNYVAADLRFFVVVVFDLFFCFDKQKDQVFLHKFKNILLLNRDRHTTYIGYIYCVTATIKSIPTSVLNPVLSYNDYHSPSFEAP